MEHEIIFDTGIPGGETRFDLLRQVISAALDAEGVDVPCEINVLITGDEEIHAINLEQREVDRPTDVLSFPMFDLAPGDKPAEDWPTRPRGWCPWGTWLSLWSGAPPRRRSSATRWSGSWPIWPSTRCSTCWATTTWTKAP